MRVRRPGIETVAEIQRVSQRPVGECCFGRAAAMRATEKTASALLQPVSLVSVRPRFCRKPRGGKRNAECVEQGPTRCMNRDRWNIVERGCDDMRRQRSGKRI